MRVSVLDNWDADLPTVVAILRLLVTLYAFAFPGQLCLWQRTHGPMQMLSWLGGRTVQRCRVPSTPVHLFLLWRDDVARILVRRSYFHSSSLPATFSPGLTF